MFGIADRSVCIVQLLRGSESIAIPIEIRLRKEYGRRGILVYVGDRGREKFGRGGILLLHRKYVEGRRRESADAASMHSPKYFRQYRPLSMFLLRSTFRLCESSIINRDTIEISSLRLHRMSSAQVSQAHIGTLDMAEYANPGQEHLE